jgi:hypothetical protein
MFAVISAYGDFLFENELFEKACFKYLQAKN